MEHDPIGCAAMTAPLVTQCGLLRGVFGESAVWSARDGGIWWVDMHGHALILTAPDGTTRYWKTPGPDLAWARAVVLHADGGLVVAFGRSLSRFDPATGQFTPMTIAPELPPGHFFNDAIVDPSGRLIIGTMLPGRGDDGRACFFQIDLNGSVRLLIDGLNTTNGLAFSPDGNTLYYSDSNVAVRTVWAAPYRAETGTLGQASVFVAFGDLPGKPDGAAIDAEGGYWSAAMASRCLHRFHPDGRHDLTITLPTDTPTRPAFGGPALDTIYLTTGGPKSGVVDDGVRGALLAISHVPGGRSGPAPYFAAI